MKKVYYVHIWYKTKDDYKTPLVYSRGLFQAKDANWAIALMEKQMDNRHTVPIIVKRVEVESLNIDYYNCIE